MLESSEEFNINAAHSDTTTNIQQDSLSQAGNNLYIPNYSLPGIIHFLEHQWRKFEIERSQWEIEKAELQSKISFLQGERRGQENLKKDMIRRIKMLEYALKQERAKNKDSIKNVVKDDGIEIDDEFIMEQLDDKDHLTDLQWKQGRHLLKQYLQEIGYADTVIDARTQRVRTLLGFSSSNYVYNNVNENPVSNVIIPKNSTSDSSTHMHNGTYETKPSSLPNTIYNQNSNMENWGIEHSQHNYIILNEKSEHSYSNERTNFLPNLQKPPQDMNKPNNTIEGYSSKAAPPYSSILKKYHGHQSSDQSDADASRDPNAEDTTETEEALSEFDFLTTPNNANTHQAIVENEPDPPEHYQNGPASKRLVNSKGLHKDPKLATSPPFYGLSNNIDSTSDFDDDTDLNAYMETDKSTMVLNDVLHQLNDKNVGGKRINIFDETKVNCGGNFSGLGDLADITVTDEPDRQITSNDDDGRLSKTWNTKLTLKGHLDSVRCIAFHPTLPLILSASEDQEIKLWNLEKNICTSKKSSADVEAIATFRKHNGPVLCISFNANGQYFASGGTDGCVYCWKLPNTESDQYESLDGAFSIQPWISFKGAHSDAIWSLKIHPVTQRIFSASADGSVVVWESPKMVEMINGSVCDHETHIRREKDSDRDEIIIVARIYPPHVASKLSKGQCELQLKPPLDDLPNEDLDAATCMEFTLSNDCSQFVVSYASSSIVIFDVVSFLPLITFRPEPAPNSTSESIYVNYIISHPTRPVIIVAHDDKCIRFFDNSTGTCLHTMVAHLDAVSCLSIDPYGLYLLSGSHDTSIRMWDYERKTCVQEITCHRKKYDEAVNSVAFHPTLSYIASAGADGIIKVYV